MSSSFKVNDQINSQSVVVISSSGESLGTLSTSEAIKIAESENLDLVEVSPNEKPPVCKIMDYGKYRYNIDKKNKKKPHKTEIKEIQFSPNIAKEDYEVKMLNVKKFLTAKNRVKITIKLKGRERVFVKNATDLVVKIKTDCADLIVQDQNETPHKKDENVKSIITTLVPKNK